MVDRRRWRRLSSNLREESAKMDQQQARPTRSGAVEEGEVRGHIIDSLLLPKILDRILQMGGTFEIRECQIGSRPAVPRPRGGAGARPQREDAGAGAGR